MTTATTMRKLVKLAYAKRDNAIAKKKRKPSLTSKHLAKSQTMSDVRVIRGRGISTEQKVAHRISLQPAGDHHLRSISLPKNKIIELSIIHVDTVDEDTEVEEEKQSSFINAITQSRNMNCNHMQAASSINSVNSINSDSTQLNSYYSLDSATTIKGCNNLSVHHKKNSYTHGSRSAISVASMSSTFESSYDPSTTTNAFISRMPPPMLETVPEPIINHDFADEDEKFQHKARNSVELKIIINGAGEIGNDGQTTTVIKNETSTYNSFWSCICCWCGSSGGNETVDKKMTFTQTSVKTSPSKASDITMDDQTFVERTHETDDRSEPVPDMYICQTTPMMEDMDDWMTWKSGQSRMRRPTQYTIATNNEDSTINAEDIRTWSEPFGKGASGRVFKGVYLPLCQVMALKVTSRLDSINVAQILGEYRQQQEFLPDCDQLMRIHGWYRNMQENQIAVALEYMDMGSIYDSCFTRDRENHMQTMSAEEEEKCGHIKIAIDKLTYEQIRFIGREVLLGLYALHSNEPSLVHRDIKPQNILMSSFGEVKIADFGLLVKIEKGEKYITACAGTQKYFSPERIDGKYNCKSDIWSYAITLIEIYKQELISADDLDFFKVMEKGIDIGEHLPVSAPTEFVEFLKKCLMHDARERPSAKELLSHRFICRKWGHPLEDSNKLQAHTIQFRDIKGNQKMLDILLSWLQEWALEDEENNAKLFLEGDNEYLKQCVFNLSKYSGCTPQYISNYVSALYHEYMS